MTRFSLDIKQPASSNFPFSAHVSFDRGWHGNRFSSFTQMLPRTCTPSCRATKRICLALLSILFVSFAPAVFAGAAEHSTVNDFVDPGACNARSFSGSEIADRSSRPPSSLRFQAEARQVLVPVVVTDESGRPVRDLDHDDFRLFEDGLEQTIDLLMDEETALTIALVVDVSGSMRSKMPSALNAIAKLVGALRPGDRVLVIGFHYGVVTIQEITCDAALAIHALEQFEPAGGTAMFDGIVEGLYRLYKIGPATRRALVLLSDGFDNASINTPRETVAAAKATGVPIYAVGLGRKQRGFFSKLLNDPLVDEFRGLDEIRLRALAENTGGRTFILSDIERRKKASFDPVANAFESLARELRAHYLLSYQPPSAELDGEWHDLRVEVLNPDLLVRFRPGYLALPLE